MISNHKPVLIVIAGPNGSGKTTVTEQILRHEWMEDAVYINSYIHSATFVLGICDIELDTLRLRTSNHSLGIDSPFADDILRRSKHCKRCYEHHCNQRK